MYIIKYFYLRKKKRKNNTYLPMVPSHCSYQRSPIHQCRSCYQLISIDRWDRKSKQPSSPAGGEWIGWDLCLYIRLSRQRYRTIACVSTIEQSRATSPRVAADMSNSRLTEWKTKLEDIKFAIALKLIEIIVRHRK